MKANYIMEKKEVDYDTIISTVELGCFDESPTGLVTLSGVNNIKNKYMDEWYEPDNKSGMDYDEKIYKFMRYVLPTRVENCNVIGAEVPFEFVYNDRVIIHGFIDRVDLLPSGYKVTDYKSSKAVFDERKIKTPMQFVIYDLACKFLYGEYPVRHEYDFILLDKTQTEKDGLCSSGYLARGIKKLNKLLDEIDYIKEIDEYVPKPSPLCYWCDYCENTPNSVPKYKDKCPYYSLWTPNKKTFRVNKEFKGDINENTSKEIKHRSDTSSKRK